MCIDTTVLGRIIERGLAADQRLVRFAATVSDKPGGIATLARDMADIGVSVKVKSYFTIVLYIFMILTHVVCMYIGYISRARLATFPCRSGILDYHSHHHHTPPVIILTLSFFCR